MGSGAMRNFAIFIVLALFLSSGEAFLCHRCMSSMGGCGDFVNWRMYPWRDCGPSQYCVKVIINTPGEEPRYIRECEHILLQSTRHRLQMPVLRRHGYCLPARKNDPWNPLSLKNSNIKYCFCNDWFGCNSAPERGARLFPVLAFSAVVGLLVHRFL